MKRRTFLWQTAATSLAWRGSARAADRFGRDRDWSGQVPVSYPEPGVEVLDKRFRAYKLGNANIQRIATGFRWAEGPVYLRDWGCLLFSDIPNNRIVRWTEENGAASVYRQPSNNTNGNTRDRQGRLISCEHATRRVVRTELGGQITVLADRYAGRPLNSPNDVVVTSDDAVWFTDPGYGIMINYEGERARAELPNAVYRLDPQGKLAVVADDLVRPNGLCFSPDEKRLYVVDTGGTHQPAGPRNIRVYDVIDGKRLGRGRVFADFAPGLSDGVRCDLDGNVWCSSGGGGPDTNGVRVHAPDGAPIGFIHLPEVCGNLCFGGVRRNRLFMCGSTSIYAVYVEALGAERP